jgi:hypothetical protein
MITIRNFVRISLLLLLSNSQVHAWRHWIYNHTDEQIRVTAQAIGFLKPISIVTKGDGKQYEIDMGPYFTKGLTIDGIDTSKQAILSNLSVSINPQLGAGVTLHIHKDYEGALTTIETPFYIAKKGKVKLRIELEYNNGSKESHYSPSKTFATVIPVEPKVEQK